MMTNDALVVRCQNEIYHTIGKQLSIQFSISMQFDQLTTFTKCRLITRELCVCMVCACAEHCILATMNGPVWARASSMAINHTRILYGQRKCQTIIKYALNCATVVHRGECSTRDIRHGLNMEIDAGVYWMYHIQFGTIFLHPNRLNAWKTWLSININKIKHGWMGLFSSYNLMEMISIVFSQHRSQFVRIEWESLSSNDKFRL